MAFGLTFYALALEMLLLYVAAFGALWAPFGALICARIAKSNGLPVRDNAVRGAAYSLCLLLPWAYFVRRLSGKRTPASCVIAGYVSLYVCWFMLLFAKGVGIAIDSVGPNEIIAILHSALLILSIVQWYFLPVVSQESVLRKSITYVHLSPFLYVSIALFLQLGYNLIDKGKWLPKRLAKGAVMIFAIAVLSILLTVPLHALWIAGALWAPFNALLCFRAAKKQGMDGWRYGVAGAVYSTFLFAPGVYLLMRLRGNAIQQPQIIAAYVALYGLWCFALIGSSGFMFLATNPFDFAQHIAPYYGIFCVAMLLVAIISCLELYAFSRNKHPLYRQTDINQNRFLNRVQLTPFVAVWLGDIGWVMLMLRT